MGDEPNFLFIQCDQLTPYALRPYGNPTCLSPAIDELAASGLVFENAYSPVPICAPSRMSMLTGLAATRIQAWDNASEIACEVPTFAHYLRKSGYRTILSGKMHFTGADQLHGFEERLTSDVYPGDFSWTPSEIPDPNYFANKATVVKAGPSTRSVQMDYDDHVAYESTQKLFDLARSPDKRPFLLLVSFTHPHEPYLCPKHHWDRYGNIPIDEPASPPVLFEDMEPQPRRVVAMAGLKEGVSHSQMMTARRGYYGAISYLDDHIARLLEILSRTGLQDNTYVILTSDHGDMLGEKGMWFKKVFYEHAAKVPLIIRGPDLPVARRIPAIVSLTDLLPTLLEMALGDVDPIEPLDGRSLLPLMTESSTAWSNHAYGEFMSEWFPAPVFMIRRGTLKYIASTAYPPQLYDLALDPFEQINRAGDSAYAQMCDRFQSEVESRWDSESLQARIQLSQRRRGLVRDAMRKGQRTYWDYEPPATEKIRWFRADRSYDAWALDDLPVK